MLECVATSESLFFLTPAATICYTLKWLRSL